MQAVNDLTAGFEDRAAEHGQRDRGSDLRATELSPSLLAIEAELRGVRLRAGDAENLQREIYQKMVQNLKNQQDLDTKGG